MTWIGWTGRAVSENDRIKAGGAPGRRRYYLSREYRSFKNQLFWHFVSAKQAQQWKTTDKPVKVEIHFHVPARMDDHNILKPVLDALQLAGWVKNDRQFMQRTLIRESNTKAAEAKIEIGIEEMQAWTPSA